MNMHVCVCVRMLALFQVVFHSLLKHVVEKVSAERFAGLFKILWTPLKLCCWQLKMTYLLFMWSPMTKEKQLELGWRWTNREVMEFMKPTWTEKCPGSFRESLLQFPCMEGQPRQKWPSQTEVPLGEGASHCLPWFLYHHLLLGIYILPASNTSGTNG